MRCTKQITQSFCTTLLCLIVLAATAACSLLSSKRPPCTWEVWSIDGRLINSWDGRTEPCQGPASVECVGMTKADLQNLLMCGGPPETSPSPQVPQQFKIPEDRPETAIDKTVGPMQ